MDGYRFTHRRAESVRPCDHPDCGEPGEHRAPKAPDRLREYFWFCKTHVREYNAAWDYCAGMGTDELEAMRRDAACWGRPTWPLGLRLGARRATGRVYDSFDFFDEEGAEKSGDEHDEFERRARPRPDEGPEQHAMRVLGLVPPLTLTALKARYKELAKQLHPDVAAASMDAEDRRLAEDRLKEINRAYAVLRRGLAAGQGRAEPAGAGPAAPRGA